MDRTTVRAELAWDDTATACGVVARSLSPVLKLCRMLIDAKHDPATPLEAWRGDTLCLRIRSIGEAAGLEVNALGNGFRPLRKADAAPPIDLTVPDHAAPWLDWLDDGGGAA